MKNIFKSFHTPSEQEFKGLWDSCLFVVDTNVLLNLYRYSEATRDQLLEILNSFKERLWLPYHTGFEFYQNRVKVIFEQQAAYDRLIKEIEALEESLKKVLDEKYSKHPSIDSKEMKAKFTQAINELKKDLESKRDVHPDLINSDVILESINGLFENRVGSTYETEKLKELFKTGEIRFKEKIAPGYEDANKEGDRKYGDFVIWSQIIDKAKESKKPIIFITDDRKDDWWLRVNGKTIGPRPELIEEIRKEADVNFYMYQSDPFIEYAAKYLQKDNQDDKIGNAIKEIREIRKEDERALDSSSPEVMEAFKQAAKANRSLFDLYNPRLNADMGLFSSSIIDKENLKFIKNYKNFLHQLDSDKNEYFLSDIYKDKDISKYLLAEANKRNEFEKELEESVRLEGLKKLLKNMEGPKKAD